MAITISLFIIGLFLFQMVPNLLGKGKKSAKRRSICKITGAVLMLLSILNVVNTYL